MKTVQRYLRLAIVLLAGWFVTLPPVHAGGSADERFGIDKFGPEAIRQFALKVNDELDRRKVNLAIIARCGRPRSELPRGISYTHVAFVVFEPVRGADGSVYYTYVTYNLYQGEKGHENWSYLKQDVTYDFVAGAAERDVAVCVPTPALQKRIIAVIRSPAYKALHTSDYNVLANPWVDRYDNCVTHMLKVCVAAIYQTDDRQRIYQDIRAYFHPTHVHVGPLKSLGMAFVSVPGLRYEDEDESGLQTACFDSLQTFLAENGLVQDAFVVRMD